MKGFKKYGKFHPTEKRNKSALKKSDIKLKYTNFENTTVFPNQIIRLMKDGFEFSVSVDRTNKNRLSVAIFDDRLTTPRFGKNEEAPYKEKNFMSQDEVDELQREFLNDPEGTYHKFKHDFKAY